MNIVIYARYSSHRQTEQSIEGQLKVCYDYAAREGMTVVGKYIDRAQSGTTDKRTEFQRMISDSSKHTFEVVLVYQLDRFARNRYDSAINKQKLKKNGVRVISARENINDDASGILVEGMLESMAEYYSAELSQKIRRGMEINAEKHLSNGSTAGLGFTVDADRQYHTDPATAPIVREIFESYANGKTIAEIVRNLNERHILTVRGQNFNKNSLRRMLSNKRYIGCYLYKDKETPNVLPRVIEDELFDKVQKMLAKNKKAPARARGKAEYLLTTKLFCGYCKEMMSGYCGTSRSGKVYHYYVCNGAKRKKCHKKAVCKDAIENKVLQLCYAQLTDSNIKQIAVAVETACKEDKENLEAKRLRKELRTVDSSIKNLLTALESGQAVKTLTDQLQKRQDEKEQLEKQLAIVENQKILLTAEQIEAFLRHLNSDFDNENNRRAIINIFVSAIYLWDDHLTVILNSSCRPVEVTAELLDEVEKSNSAFVAVCSSLNAQSPPNPKAP